MFRVDNEDNASIALKVLVELNRSYKGSLEENAKNFLDIVMEMYANMEQAVKEAFDDQVASAVGTVSALQSHRHALRRCTEKSLI